MQINRLLELVYILLHRKNMPAKALAQQLGVSTRTIYRDIETLSIAGIPIYTVKGKGGGVRLLPESVLNKSILSEQEQNEILTALHGLSQLNDSNQVLKKLSTIFDKPATNWLSVDFSDWSGANDYFNQFKTAILTQHIAQFDYYNSYGNKTTRTIEPLQLWFKSKAWYVKGYCLDKQDLRTYKLTRIKNLHITPSHFPQRTLPDTAPTNQALPPTGETIRLRILPAAIYRLFDDFEETDVVKQPDGSYIATIIWEIDPWVHGFILSYGEDMQVLSPPHLQQSIQAKAKNIAEKYV